MPPKGKENQNVELRNDLLLLKKEIIDSLTSSVVELMKSEISLLVKQEIDKALGSLSLDLVTRFEDIDTQFKKVSESINTTAVNIVTTIEQVSSKINNVISNADDKFLKSRTDLPTDSFALTKTSFNLSEALTEISEREKKKDNIIIFNVNEKVGSVDDKIKHDQKMFADISQAIGVPVTKPIAIYRIGRAVLNKNRPLVVKTAEKAEIAKKRTKTEK